MKNFIPTNLITEMDKFLEKYSLSKNDTLKFNIIKVYLVHFGISGNL